MSNEIIYYLIIFGTVNLGYYYGKQRYKCNECGKHFYQRAKYHKHPEKVKLLALKVYSEGMITSAIARVLNLPY